MATPGKLRGVLLNDPHAVRSLLSTITAVAGLRL